MGSTENTPVETARDALGAGIDPIIDIVKAVCRAATDSPERADEQDRVFAATFQFNSHRGFGLDVF